MTLSRITIAIFEVTGSFPVSDEPGQQPAARFSTYEPGGPKQPSRASRCASPGCERTLRS